MKKRNILCMLLAVTLILSNICSVDAAKKTELSFKKITLYEGQKKKITFKKKNKKAAYIFISSQKKKVSVSKSGVITAKKQGKVKITVKEKLKSGRKQKAKKIGTISVTCKKRTASPSEPASNGQSSAVAVQTAPPQTMPPNSSVAPLETHIPSMTGLPSATGLPSQTALPTPDLYTKKVLSVHVTESNLYTVEGSTCRVDMQYFSADASGGYFNGATKNEGTSVIKDYTNGSKQLCSRYILSGTDADGTNCSIFIEDNATADENGNFTTRPTIITDSKALAFLETADLQGRITDNGDHEKTIDIFWNESNTEPVAPPAAKRPDDSLKYDKEIFTFSIDIKPTTQVTGTAGWASMIQFGATADCENFKGTIVADNVDTRLQFNGQLETLSARYILSGTDKDGNPCNIYVENNGISENGTMVTEPIVITDCPDYAWIESAPLHGTTSWSPGLTIHILTTE